MPPRRQAGCRADNKMSRAASPEPPPAAAAVEERQTGERAELLARPRTTVTRINTAATAQLEQQPDLQRQLTEKTEELERLKKELQVRIESEEQMKQVLKEYEKTISDLIMEKENDKEKLEAEVTAAAAEKQQAVEDLQNVETAFADVHRKYERTKQVVEGFKKNEEQLKQFVEDHKEKLKKQDQKYNMLKAHAEEKLEQANKEIDKISRSQVSPHLAALHCLLC